MTETQWFKYTFLCLSCDALYEISSKQPAWGFDPICSDMHCDGLLHLLSVVDVTIPTIQPAQPKENIMDTTMPITDPNQRISVFVNGGRVTKTLEEVSLDIVKYNNLVEQNHANNQKFVKVQDILDAEFEDSLEQDVLKQIAQALELSLTKEIIWTATVTITGTVEVDMADEDFDLESEVSDELSSSLCDYDYSIDNVEER